LGRQDAGQQADQKRDANTADHRRTPSQLGKIIIDLSRPVDQASA
jgi:hypothetical protein